MIQPLRGRASAAALAAPVAVGLTLACLAIGYEPIQGDPDLMYRPIKAELARALARGSLPLWSDRLGLGVPLAAESHVAAFYPMNWFLYSVLTVPAAYRLALWLHMVATAAATFAYGRTLGLNEWGASLAALAFSLCGFQASHAGHEPLYHAQPFLPLCLLAADRLATTGRLRWVAILALAWGAQLTVGHFQIQLWTGGLVLLTGIWRIVAGHLPKARAMGLALALMLGACVAAPQLALTWELTSVTSFARGFDQLSNYAFPPAHLMQAALPTLFLPNAGLDEVTYWGPLTTSSGEATFYVGTVPLILACVGLIGGRPRGLTPWRWIAAAGVVLATMPHWWPLGYWAVTCIPGLGWFRCPARYTLMPSLGLALLAGGGLDEAISPKRFRFGLALAITLAITSLAGALWLVAQPRYRATFGESTLPYRFGSALLLWTAGVSLVIAWRRAKLGAWALVALTAIELGAIYHLGPVRWGSSVAIAEASPILRRLAEEPHVGLIAGQLENLPLRSGLTPAYPYLGIPPPSPNYLLEATRSVTASKVPGSARWLRRFGVAHGIWHEGDIIPDSETLWIAADPALDKLLRNPRDASPAPRWKIVRYRHAWPSAWACRSALEAADWATLYGRLSGTENRDEAWFLAGELPAGTSSTRASSARVRSWDGRTAVVEHDGTCDLIVRRTAYPGWTARLGGGGELVIHKANGGLQSVQLEGSGPSSVHFTYNPAGLKSAVAVSIAAMALCGLVLTASVCRAVRPANRAGIA